MRLALTIVSPAARRQADVLLEADPATPVGEVAAQLDRLLQAGPVPAAPPPGVLAFPGPRRAAGEPARVSLFVDQALVPPGQPVGQSPIRQGCVVSLGSPAASLRPEPRGVVEIQVAGGPAAGAVHRLTLGEADIGGPNPDGTAPAHIVIADPQLPALALRVSVDHRGDCLVAPYDGGPAALDREPLTGPAPRPPPGRRARLVPGGGPLRGRAPYEPPDAALHPSEDGAGVDFNRPPRLLPPERAAKFSLPQPPARPERRPMPILMAVLPVLAGVAMAVFLHEIYLLAMCALSPVTLIGSHIRDRRQGRPGPRSHGQQTASYAEHKARIEADARTALAAERVQRRTDCPDPAVVLTIASGPRRRLWERRRTDPDYLLLRVGTADLPSAVELTDPTQDEHRRTVVWEVPDAPVAVPLRERGVLGVAGPDDAPRSVGRWLVAQAATLHSPNDLQLYVLTDSSGRSSWEWAKWLPHCRSADGRAVALIGNDAETVAGRIAELLSILTDRQRAQRDAGMGPVGSQVSFRQDIVVVFDGSRKLRMLPGAVQILREGPQAGIFAICLDADERLLPAECQAVTTAEPGGLRVQQMGEDTLAGVRPPGPGHGPGPGRQRQRRRGRPARRLPAAGRARPGAAGAEPDRGRLERQRPGHPGRAGRVLRRAVRPRPAPGRAARPDRRDHRLRQVGAAADAGRILGGGQPARGHDLRAGRLQGRQRVQGLRPAPAHGGHGHRPGRAPGRAGPGVAVGRADPARAHPGRGRRQGHRGLHDQAGTGRPVPPAGQP